jgi:hypothetical protein
MVIEWPRRPIAERSSLPFSRRGRDDSPGSRVDGGPGIAFASSKSYGISPFRPISYCRRANCHHIPAQDAGNPIVLSYSRVSKSFAAGTRFVPESVSGKYECPFTSPRIFQFSEPSIVSSQPSSQTSFENTPEKGPHDVARSVIEVRSRIYWSHISGLQRLILPTRFPLHEPRFLLTIVATRSSRRLSSIVFQLSQSDGDRILFRKLLTLDFTLQF